MLFSRTRNQLLATLSVRGRREVVLNKPTHIFLEVTNHCNLACVMCGRTHDRRHQQESFLGHMSLETVRKLEAYYAPSCFVTATGLGEPFLNPEMIPILGYLKRQGAVVSLTTNGTILDDAMIGSLIDLEVDRVVCSLDSQDGETFARIRVGASLDEVLSNLERLADARRRSPSGKPYLILEFVAMAQNFHELPRIADLAGRLGFDEVIVQNLFKSFAPGYDVFYRRNKLSALDPGEVLDTWNEFLARLRSHSIKLYSPFSGERIREYLRQGEESSTRPGKARANWIGYIDTPLPNDSVSSRFRVSGWVLNKTGRPLVEMGLETATQTLDWPVELDVVRPDVPPALPEGFPSEALCGFSMDLDVSEVGAGVATLFMKARVTESAEPVVLGRRQIVVGEQDDSMYCTQPWSTLFVTWQGHIRTCCFNELKLDDLSSRPAGSVWNGDGFRQLRGKVVRGQVIPECMDCLAGKSNPDYVRSLRSWLHLPGS